MNEAMVPSWGEAHAWEAGARTYELAAHLHRAAKAAGRTHCREGLLLANAATDTEYLFRDALKATGFKPHRIDREVQRVRDIAEGRKKRVTIWRVLGKHAAEEDGVFWESEKRPPKSVCKDRITVRVTKLVTVEGAAEPVIERAPATSTPSEVGTCQCLDPEVITYGSSAGQCSTCGGDISGASR